MRTVQITRFGDPEVLQLREVPNPTPRRGGVVIAVDVVEVLFLDTQLRAGWGKHFFPMRPPWTPGTGVAGSIQSVGEGVAPSLLGTRVIARTGDEGAYAELVSVDAGDMAVIPDGVGSAVATGALHDGPLALDRLERAALGPDGRVLVTAAAGSLGQWLVPLVAATGAYVVGAAGGAEKAGAVSALGADRAVDYRQPGWVRDAGGPFDVVFDGAGGSAGRTALALTADHGTFFGHGAASGEFAATEGERGIRMVGVDVEITPTTWRRHVRSALDLVRVGQVRPHIGQALPLDHAAEAHAAIARREIIGKSVLRVGTASSRSAQRPRTA